jgi:hypothetical protein
MAREEAKEVNSTHLRILKHYNKLNKTLQLSNIEKNQKVKREMLVLVVLVLIFILSEIN